MVRISWRNNTYKKICVWSRKLFAIDNRGFIRSSQRKEKVTNLYWQRQWCHFW